MAVAHSASSESHTGATGSQNQAVFTWTHTQTGTPQGVLCFVHVTNSATDTVTSVTYGSVTLTRVSGGAAIDSAGEPGRTDLFFAGSGLPTGNQTVTVNRVNNANIMYATVATVTAATNTNVLGIVLLQGDGTLAEQSVNDGSPGSNSVRYAGITTGLNAPPVAGASSTLLQSIDVGNQCAALVRETTAGQGARNVGFSSGTTDDRAGVHVAVRELFNRVDNAVVGTFTLTGQPNTLARGRVMTGATGTFTLNGQPADLRHNPNIEAGVGTFTLAGQPADTRHNVRIEAGTGVFNLVGNNATLTKATAPKVLTAETGIFTFTGNPATTKVAVLLAAEVGTFNFVGNPATLTKAANKQLLPLVGPFTLTGNPASLTKSKLLVAERGIFTFTGNQATLKYSVVLDANRGQFNLVGNDAGLRYNAVLNAERGQFLLAGNAATLSIGKSLPITVGTFTLTGNPVSFVREDRLEAIKGDFLLTGLSATLTKASTARRRNVFIF